MLRLSEDEAIVFPVFSARRKGMPGSNRAALPAIPSADSKQLLPNLKSFGIDRRQLHRSPTGWMNDSGGYYFQPYLFHPCRGICMIKKIGVLTSGGDAPGMNVASNPAPWSGLD